MGMKSVAILLILLLFWWLIRKWDSIRTRKGVRNRAENRPNPDDPAFRGNRNSVATKNKSEVTDKSPDMRGDNTSDIESAKPAKTANAQRRYTANSSPSDNIAHKRFDFNQIEVDRAAHQHQSNRRASDQPTMARSVSRRGDYISNQSPAFGSRLESSVVTEDATPNERSALITKVKYLEKQIHENNRDITMLSDNVAKLKDVNRLSQQQHAIELRSEKDKVLFFETRLTAEIDKLAQIQSSLDSRGMTLDQFADVIARSEELEARLAMNDREISRLKELLALSRGYQTGSNKRNKELTLLKKQAQRIGQLESQLASQDHTEGL